MLVYLRLLQKCVAPDRDKDSESHFLIHCAADPDKRMGFFQTFREIQFLMFHPRHILTPQKLIGFLIFEVLARL